MVYERLTTRGYKGHIVNIIEYNLGNNTEDVTWLKKRIEEVNRRIFLSFRY